MEGLLAQEPALRLGVFIGVFVAMAAWEWLVPRRPLAVGKAYRWTHNLGLLVIDSLLVRLLFPTAAVGVALLAEARGWGWGFWQLVDAPWWLAIPLSVILLDFAIWAQHLAFHHVPVLWRLHRVHHADLDVDTTTGLRFHPLEILLSMLIKAGVVLMLGAPAVAVLIFEVLLNATSLFNHGNVRFPPHLEPLLRWFVVTPEMHRIHHSWYRDETNSNFGFNLPWWDRLLGTYRDQPRDGHLAMTLGIEQFRDPRELRLDRLLLQPFRGPAPAPPADQPPSTSP